MESTAHACLFIVLPLKSPQLQKKGNFCLPNTFSIVTLKTSAQPHYQIGPE